MEVATFLLKVKLQLKTGKRVVELQTTSTKNKDLEEQEATCGGPQFLLSPQSSEAVLLFPTLPKHENLNTEGRVAKQSRMLNITY